MPAGNQHTGDVLDRALHVARTQAATVPGQQGFFNALKPQSTSFPQTSRINVARPAAQEKTAALVVPPAPTVPTRAENQATLAAHMPHASSVTGIAKTVAGAVAAHPVRSALQLTPAGPLANPLIARATEVANTETNKGLAGLAKLQAPQSGADLQGAASVNAAALNAARGVPLASLSTTAQAKLKTAESFFATHPSYHYDVPNLGLYGATAKKNEGLPPTATDADVIRKAFGPYTGHRGYVSGLIHNAITQFPTQLAAAPVGGAYLLTHPLSGGKEAVRENVQFSKDLVEHPLRTLHDQPITTLTTALGLARGVGGLAGTAARTGVPDAMLGIRPSAVPSLPYMGSGLLEAISKDELKRLPPVPRRAGPIERFATPADRRVVPNLGANPMTPEGVELQPKAISRGKTSTKLDERTVQAISDKLASGTQFFGRRLQKQHNDAITRSSIQRRDALEREHIEPAIRAAAKLSPTEERATRFVHGQALGTPNDHAVFMQRQADAHRATDPGAGTPGHERWAQEQRTLDADAKLWSKVASNRKIGDELTPNQQDYLAKATHASRFGEQDLAGMNRRGTDVPLVSSTTALRSAYAPAAAVRGIDVRDTPAMNTLRAENRAKIGAPPVAPNSPLDEFDPLYNPHQVESPKAMRGLRRGDSLPMMHDNPATRFGNRRLGTEGDVRTGAMIPKGQATSAAHVYFGAVAKPLRVAAALDHFRQQGATWIRDVPAGTAYDTRHWVRVRDSHAGLPNADVHTAVDTHEATAQADDAQTLRQQILGGVEPDSRPIAHVPEGGTYHLAPRQSIDNLENRLKGLDRGTLAKIAKTGTGLWRWTTLMARPAWLVNNIAGNLVQASIAGAGPGDWIKAWKQGRGGAIQGVENAGQFKNVFGQKPTLGNTALKPVHAFTNTVVEANVRFENLARRAVANHALSKLAKAHVHGEIGTIRSSFHHSSEAVRNAMENPTPEMHARAVQEVDHALGNFIRTKASPGLDLVAPFHRWFGFIVKYTADLPIATPGRALLLQRLGQLGINVQNQAFGGFTPNSLVGSIPIAGGLYKSTQGLNPLASAFQLLAPTDQSSNDPGSAQGQGLLGATNPLFQALGNWATGKDVSYGGSDDKLKDQYNNPVQSFDPNVLVNQVENTLPFFSVLHGYNAPANAINPIHPGAARRGALSQTPTPLDQRVLGYLGGSVRPYDPRLNQAAALKRLVPALKTEARNRVKNS